MGRHVISFVDRASLRPLKIVAGHGERHGWSWLVPTVFKSLPFSVEILFPSSMATSPITPPTPYNPRTWVDLKAAVLEQGADIGLAFDGDAESCVLVDERADPVSRISHHRARRPGPCCRSTRARRSCTTSSAPMSSPRSSIELGGTPIRTRVGHSNIKAGDGRNQRHLRRRALGALLLP